MWQYTPYTIPLLVTAAVTVALAAYILSLRHRSTGELPGALAFGILLLGVTEWCTSAALGMASVELEAKLIWANLSFVGIGVVPVSWFVFALNYTGRGQILSGGRLWLLAVVPTITVALAWTSPHHDLMRLSPRIVEVDSFRLLVNDFGLWFWVHATYLYLLLAIGTLALARWLLRSPGLYRGQAVSVLVGAVTPWAGNAVYIFGFSQVDITPIAFAVTGVVVAYGLFHFRLLDVLPMARSVVLEEMEDGVIVLDNANRIVDLNPAGAHLLSRSAGELIGRPAAEAFVSLAALAECLREDGHTAEVSSGQGSERRVWDVRITPLHLGGRPAGRLLLLRDISEGKRMQEEMVVTERLRAAGELAVGIGHNLNNILTGILAPVSILQDSSDAETREWAEIIFQSAKRARDLVRRLGSTVRSQKDIQIAPIDVNELILGVCEATRPRWEDEATSRQVEIAVDLHLGQIPRAAAEQTGLFEVVLNLLLNAIDALGESGGTIAMSTSSSGDEIIIRVSDNGIGMEEETRRRVFEPFFTTKVNVGSGLGLSTAYRTVMSWGGGLSVASASGEGTTFEVRLPQWTGELPEPARADEDGSPKQAAGGAAVLIAEDEAVVTTILADTMNEMSHSAKVVSDGNAALELVASGHFEVALLDLGLPGVSGDVVAAAIKEADPSIVTVLMTGWTLEESDPRLSHFDLFLQKPFDVQEIQRVMTRALSLRDSRR